MDRQTKPQNTAQKSAQTYFTKSAQDDTLAKQTRKKERNVTEAKIAKLRELRLAKEAGDKQEADRLAAETPEAAPSRAKKRTPAVKAAKPVRMIY